jgi:hypothetical protein
MSLPPIPADDSSLRPPTEEPQPMSLAEWQDVLQRRPRPPPIASLAFEEATHPIGYRLQPGEFHPQRQAFLKSAFDTSAIRSRIGADNEAINAYNKQIGALSRVRNPYAGYSFDNTAALVDLFGTKNAAVKFNPTFNSRNAAEEYIAKQRQRAELSGNPSEIDKWKRYGVRELDLDNDPATINNVVVYSDVGNQRIKSIDGYQLTPKNKKESLRVLYDVYPTKEAREINFSPENRKHYKAYFRKYPNPNTWNAHPFDEFVKELPNKESLFTIFRKLMEEYMIIHNFTMFSEEKDKTYNIEYAEQKGTIVVPKNTGQLTVAHYMTILQKLTSLTMMIAYRVIAPPLPNDYDFSKDPWKVKSKSNQDKLKNILGYRPEDAMVQKLITIIPGAKSIETGIRNKPLGSTIAFIAQFTYFVDNGRGPIIKLLNGTVVNDAHVFRDIDEINMKSTTGSPELAVNAIDANQRYTITDYLKKTKAERAAERATRKATFTKVDKFEHPGAKMPATYEAVRVPSIYYTKTQTRPLIHETPLKADVLPTTFSDIQTTPFRTRGRGRGRGGGGRGGGGLSGLSGLSGLAGSGSSVDSPLVITDSPMAPDYDESQIYEPPE